MPELVGLLLYLDRNVIIEQSLHNVNLANNYDKH